MPNASEPVAKISFHKNLLQSQRLKQYPTTILISISLNGTKIPCVKTFFKYFGKFLVFSLSGKMNIQISCSPCALATLKTHEIEKTCGRVCVGGSLGP